MISLIKTGILFLETKLILQTTRKERKTNNKTQINYL